MRICLFLLLLWGFGVGAVAGDPVRRDFSFAVFGDSRPWGNKPIPDVCKKIVADIERQRPALIFHTGDFIYGYNDTPSQLLNEYAQAKAVFSAFSAPLIIAPGNHDYFSADSERLFHQYTRQAPYFSLDKEGCHFIVLNTEIKGQKGVITGAQWEWLKNDLAQAKTARAIFVFLHIPLFASTSPRRSATGPEYTWFSSEKNRDRLAALFAQYKVHTVFAGHNHLYFKTRHSGVNYVVTGGGGAPLYAKPSRGGFYHWVLARVTENGVSLSVRRDFP